MTAMHYCEDPSEYSTLYAHVSWFHSGSYTAGYYGGWVMQGTSPAYFDSGWIGISNPGGYYTAAMGFGGNSTNNAWCHAGGALTGRWVG
jgi:hypothetical protein